MNDTQRTSNIAITEYPADLNDNVANISNLITELKRVAIDDDSYPNDIDSYEVSNVLFLIASAIKPLVDNLTVSELIRQDTFVRFEKSLHEFDINQCQLNSLNFISRFNPEKMHNAAITTFLTPHLYWHQSLPIKTESTGGEGG